MDSAERAALHARLDELLDRRERIEAHVYKYPMGSALNGEGDLDPRSAYAESVALARAMAGPIIPWRIGSKGRLPEPGRTLEADTLLGLQDWLELHAPLLKPGGKPPEVPVGGAWKGATVILGEWPIDAQRIGSELGSLIRGETSDLFAAAPRLPGQPAKPFTLAFARLMALALDRLYATENARRPDRERAAAVTWRAGIAAAFGVAGWGTIEKWNGSCRQYLGDWIVDRLLEAASQAVPVEHGGLGLDAATHARGAEFQQVARAAKGGERKRRQPRHSGSTKS